jgi:hypothetical protein
MKIPKLVLKTTDIFEKNEFDLYLDIKGFNLFQKSSKRYSKDVLIYCYVSYPWYDFILKYNYILSSVYK